MNERTVKTMAAVMAAATLMGTAPAAMAAEPQEPPATGETQDAVSEARDLLLGDIADAQALLDNGRDWTADTRDAVAAAISAANGVLGNQDADLDAVNGARSALNTAVAALRTTAQVTLAASIARVADLEEDTYTAATWAVFAAALDTARGSFADTVQGDEARQAAADALDKAAAALVTRSRDAYDRAVARARAILDRNLTYDDTSAIDALRAKLEDAQADTDADDGMLAAYAKELDTLAGKIGLSREETAFTDTLAHANTLDQAKYSAESWGTLQAALDDANAIDPSTADADTLTRVTQALQAGIDGLRAATWTIGGITLTETDGRLTGTLDHMPDNLTLTGSDGTRVTLTATVTDEFTQGEDTLGVGTTTSVLSGDAQGTPVTVTVTQAVGEETTGRIDDTATTAFTRGEDGTWTAAASMTLGSTRTDQGVEDVTAWAGGPLVLSDGTTLDDPQPGEVTESVNDGARTWTRDITYSGTDAHGTPVAVTVTASRTYDPRISVHVTRTPAEGEPGAIGVLDAVDASGLTGDVTLAALPHDAAADDYTLDVGELTGDNVRDVRVANGLGANGQRVFVLTLTADALDGTRLTARTVTLRVIQPFDEAPTVTANPQAALESIKVNGQTIAGWDPDRLDYTITAGATEPVTVSPVAPEGVTVVAGDITQTAYTTRQSWTSTAADGASRTYTVTLVREHTEPTAVEKFTPPQAEGLVSDAENPSPDNTTLESVGWIADGEYHAADSDTYTIPEGGAFAWRSYAGQTVTPTMSRLDGMTYRYDLGVLSADREHYATRTITVTYLTADTTRAELTGIDVDGKAVDGFAADRLEYTVGVDNPDRYTVVPRFDRLTGMSVTMHKDGRDSTIRVVSADGLTERTYTVHATDIVSGALANTGVAVLGGVIAVILLALAGGVALLLRRRGHADVTDPGLEADVRDVADGEPGEDE